MGRGSAFRVLLPPRRRGGDRAAPLPATPATGAPRARILIIDDEPLVRRAIERSLEPEHDVVSAASAAEALAGWKRGEPFDLVLCDLMMPEMTGMEMAARLERSLPAMAARMVFLSGGAFTPEAAAFLAVGRQPLRREAVSARRALASGRGSAGRSSAKHRGNLSETTTGRLTPICIRWLFRRDAILRQDARRGPNRVRVLGASLVVAPF